jgi:hypothetical protein
MTIIGMDAEVKLLMKFFSQRMNKCACGGQLDYTYNGDPQTKEENILRRCSKCGKKEVFEGLREFLDNYQNPDRKITWKLVESPKVFKAPAPVNQGDYKRVVQRKGEKG